MQKKYLQVLRKALHSVILVRMNKKPKLRMGAARKTNPRQTHPALRAWYKRLGREGRNEVAAQLGMTSSHFTKAISAGDLWSHERAVKIEYLSLGAVRREDLLAADWELLRREPYPGATAQQKTD
ncbi:hypothetical protein [Uliginosibacterium sediminicola]|uniref:Uncharacterized protein n=1 Tax=Uliginosibacterium sediminicola TaxID=2024550 RepID=A0ABU9YW23_9RHOO